MGRSLRTPTAPASGAPATRRAWAVSGLLVGLLVSSALAAPSTAAGSTTDSSPVTGAVATEPSSPDHPRYVVAISVDGLSPRAITSLGPAGTPAFHRMMAEGASTLNARTAYERTTTLPNHTGMLTGRRVLGRRGHHVGFNFDLQTSVAEEAGHYRRSLFDVVHNRGGRTALLAGKEKFAMFDRSWGPELGAPDRVGVDDGQDKIDRYVLARPWRLVKRLVRWLGNDPIEATFLHIPLPDEAGHQHGFGSAGYLDAVQRSDRLVGRILDAVSADTALRSSVNVVLTADHGGPAAKDHGSPADPSNYTIPLLVWGPDAAPGADLYELNPGRTDPGADRPHYRQAPPVRNTDVASLVTTLLGHPPVPGGLLRGTEPLQTS